MGKPNIDRIIAIHGKLPEGAGKMSYSQLEAAYGSAQAKIEDLEKEVKNLTDELNSDPARQVKDVEDGRSDARPELPLKSDLDGDFNDDELRI